MAWKFVSCNCWIGLLSTLCGKSHFLCLQNWSLDAVGFFNYLYRLLWNVIQFPSLTDPVANRRKNSLCASQSERHRLGLSQWDSGLVGFPVLSSLQKLELVRAVFSQAPFIPVNENRLKGRSHDIFHLCRFLMKRTQLVARFEYSSEFAEILGASFLAARD